jgi:hypothetical protein
VKKGKKEMKKLTIFIILLTSIIVYSYGQKAITNKPNSPAVTGDNNVITVNGTASIPAMIDSHGKLIVTISKYSEEALLSCDSIHHEWIDGPDFTFQHCKICGVLRIKPENAK